MFNVLKIMARMKALRGGALDLFGKTAERRMERALIGEYRELVLSVLPKLNASTQSNVQRIAELPEMIRGYGPIKERNVAQYRAERDKLLAELNRPAVAMAA